jgi:hypothetical protein
MTAFTRDKRDLEQALLIAEQRLARMEAETKGSDELVAVARDLALGLDVEISEHGTTLDARGGGVGLSLPAERLFVPGGDALTAEAASILARIERVTAAHPDFSLALASSEPSDLSRARVLRLVAALRERGVDDRRILVGGARPDDAEPAAAADSTLEPDAAATDPVAETQGDEPLPAADPPAPPGMPSTERYEIVFSVT